MKVAIDLICRRLSANPRSHTLSWVMLRKNQLEHLGLTVDVLHEPIAPEAEYTAWQGYDVIYLYHEMAMERFQKSRIVNVYDIMTESAAWFFQRLAWKKHAHIKFISLDFPMLNYGYRCKRKSNGPMASQAWKSTDWDLVQERCDLVTEWVLDPLINFTEHLVIGDSHAHSVYEGGASVWRADGRTLAGAVRRGFRVASLEAGYPFDNVRKLTTYYGSIDIRHHLCRADDPAAETKRLVKDYVEELRRAEKPEIEACIPLPIEDESRIIPKMGWYKGRGYYGSRAQRVELLHIFRQELEEASAKHGFSVFAWPQEWYDMDPIEFFRLMERPRSVHLGWENYRWDLELDRPNTRNRSIDGAAANLLTF